MKKTINEQRYINKRIGKLVITKLDHIEGDEVYWQAHCDCGADIIITNRNIVSYQNPNRRSIPSCKHCNPVSRVPLEFQLKLSDGSYDSRYLVWNGLRSSFRKGLCGLDSDWFDCNNFVLWAELFYGWTDPTISYTVHRYDPQADYSPENCFLHLATKDQMGSYVSRIPQVYTVKGETYTVREWASLYNISVKAIYSTIRTHPVWSFSRVLEWVRRRTNQQLRDQKESTVLEERKKRQEGLRSIKKERKQRKHMVELEKQELEAEWLKSHPQPQKKKPTLSYIVKYPVPSCRLGSNRPSLRRKNSLPATSFEVILPNSWAESN